MVLAAPVPELAKQFAATNHFSLRLVYVPADIGRFNRRIVSIATKAGQVNLSLYQAGPTLVFWFRTPLTANRPTLSLRTTRVLRVNEPNDILFSYDGSSLQAYVDGISAAPGYVLGPGAVLVERFYRPNPVDLAAVEVLSYGAMFLPAGLLAGLAIRSLSKESMRAALYLLIVLLAAVALETAYSTISRRPFSVEGILVPIAFAGAGALWIYADNAGNSRAYQAGFASEGMR